MIWGEASCSAERGRSKVATLEPSNRMETHTCTFEGYRSSGATGVHRASGPPPKKLCPRLEAPRDPFEGQAIEESLKTLATLFPNRASLKLTQLFSQRAAAQDGNLAWQRNTAVWALVGSIAIGDGRHIPIGWSGSASQISRLSNPIMHERLRCLVEAVAKAESIYTGEFPAVLGPQAAAVLLHETVGHFAEGSSISSINLQHRIGVRIASELIEVVDDPTYEDGATQYDLDDDGIASFAPTRVLRQGVLFAQLHSQESAAHAFVLPTANGRAASAMHAAIPRISNLLCEPGATSTDELIDSVQDGLYIHHLAHGQGFGFEMRACVTLAEVIKHGRLTGRFLSGGQIYEQVGVLNRVEALGDRCELNANGMCGKAGQILFDVGTSCPPMRLSNLQVTA